MQEPSQQVVDGGMSASEVRRVFVSWAPFCSRSDNIARELRGSSFMIYHRLWGSNYLTIALKYASQTVATLRLLSRVRPTCVFVMNPPPVACFAVWLYARQRGIPFVIDAHSAAFVDKRWRALEGFQRYLARQALTTLVTNTHWQRLVEVWGARSDILADVPVMFPEPAQLELGPGFHVAIVSTFTWDEPTGLVFEAARHIPHVSFHMTGDHRRLKPATARLKPSNLRLTGFLPDAEYAGLLRNCDAVMSLTVLDHTMQRGAYEAAYLGKPIITSNFELLRAAFPRGAVFADNDIQSIRTAVEEMRRNIAHYENEARQLAKEKLVRWGAVKKGLESLVTQAEARQAGR